jgi:hypothetical protein
LKNSRKLYIAFTIYTMLIVLAAILGFGGCGENGIVAPEMKSNQLSGAKNQPPGVVVGIQKDTAIHKAGLYKITVTNFLTDTLMNDFHIQFQDGITIRSEQTTPTGWIQDQNTTNFSEGRIGWLTNNTPIHSHCTCFVPHDSTLNFFVVLRFPNDGIIWNFNWQATRDGITIWSGTGHSFVR